MRISDWSSDVCSSDLPGAEAIVELLGLGPADYRPGQHPGQGALVGLDGFGEGAETGSAQLIAFGDGLGGIAEGADLDGKAAAGGQTGGASWRERECQSVYISVGAV